MPRALRQSRDGHIIGVGTLPAGSSVAQSVHDGDTVAIDPFTYLSTRLLGVDTPEVSFALPGVAGFPSIGSTLWADFLDDPFDPRWPPFTRPLPAMVVEHLSEVVGEGCAANHARHAEAATLELRRLIGVDVDAAGGSEAYRFFLAFGSEVLDRYGRLLAFVHLDDVATKPPPYNDRLLEAGVASPYFIWPNLMPFMSEKTVPAPGRAGEGRIGDARRTVAAARARRIGIYDADEPLRLAPFELRFLARREPPDRWVIDMSAGDDVILPPERYVGIDPEDRLFVNLEHVPLFVERGWRPPAAADASAQMADQDWRLAPQDPTTGGT